jgi:hypothetical protein
MLKLISMYSTDNFRLKIDMKSNMSNMFNFFFQIIVDLRGKGTGARDGSPRGAEGSLAQLSNGLAGKSS